MPRTLGVDELYKCCDLKIFDFRTTRELSAIDGTIGQERALRAIDFGLNLESAGFNIFLLGENGTGKMTSIKSILKEKAFKEPVPPDWCYVYNFKDPDVPHAIALEPGRAEVFQKDMEELVKILRVEIPKVFESKEYEKQRSKIFEEFQKKQRELFSVIEEEAQGKGFSIRKTVSGLLIVTIKKSGEPLSEEEFEALDEKTKKKIEEMGRSLQEKLDDTVRTVREMEKQGADIIELGIPYSDPIAEGPVIQAANERALSKGIRISDIMSAVAEIRKSVSVPLVYLLYYNCILQYGPERFFSDCSKAGIDGLIIPDLPFEERGEIDETADKYGVVIITLVSPVSNERIEKIAARAKGFLYCVSSMGVTGVRNDFQTDFNNFFSYINKATDIPKALGFGISTKEHVAMLKGYCDGLIIGSAIVRLVGQSADADSIVRNVGGYIKELRTAMDA
jgi:tryptophan synthase alpha subunit